MKFLATLALALPAVSSAAVRVRDPDVLAQIADREAIVRDLIARGETVPVRVPQYNTSLPEGEARLQATPIGFSVIAGLALVSSGNLGYQVMVDIGTHLGEFFFKPNNDAIWHSTEYCRTYFDTQGGGNCEIRTYERGSSDRTSTHNPDNG